MRPPAPIDGALAEISAAVARAPVTIISAAPGTGKTTRVPLCLSETLGLSVLMLEPRRLAAQNAAKFMARLLGEPVGCRVGYRIRGDAAVSDVTTLQVITEGLLTRMLQSDPGLSGFEVVIFDEFHERNLHTDLGLALTLDAQQVLRPDLKIVIMSATLDAGRLKEMFPDAPWITVAAPSYPVTTEYRPLGAGERLEDAVRSVVEGSVARKEGDILVFLPGQGEIERARGAFRGSRVLDDLLLTPLAAAYGQAAAEIALGPTPPGKTKVVLATTIAETSVTIPGVTLVVDSGLARESFFDQSRGMNGLETVSVSQAASDQRRGRAGRTAPGRCVRLWAREKQQSLPAQTIPEIQRADLTQFALELAAWGANDSLPLIEPPPQGQLERARAVLGTLKATDGQGAVTAFGRELIELGIHPRLGSLVLQAAKLGAAEQGCALAALLEERDPLSAAAYDVTIETRLDALRDPRGFDGSTRGRLERMRENAAHLLRRLPRKYQTGAGEVSCAELLLAAYPDRLAERRAAGERRYLLSSGVGAELPPQSLLHKHQFLVVAAVDGAAAHARIQLATAVAPERVDALVREHGVEESVVEFEAETGRLTAESWRRIGALRLQRRSASLRNEEVSTALEHYFHRHGVAEFPWSDSAQQLRMRSEWLRLQHHVPETWPDLSDAGLAATLDRWLSPWSGPVRSIKDLEQVPQLDMLLSLFRYEERRDLDALAPAELILAGTRRHRIIYAPHEEHPRLGARIQDFFGRSETPRIVRGQVPLLVELQNPARRAVQTTLDLKSFWATVYPELRSALRARYPKHRWPEHPERGE